MRKHADDVIKVLDEHKVDEPTKKALVDYFTFASNRYYALRKALIVFAIIISLGCGFGIQQALQAQHDFEQDANLRRSQGCVIQEREQDAAAKQLANTYRYLRALPKEEAKSTLNQFIIRRLPETEREARAKIAPPYCNDKGIGLEEPQAKFPERQDFSHLLIKR